METADKTSIIHRKAEGGRSEFKARVMSPDKALRLALAKVSDKLLDLALTVTTVEQVVLSHGKIRDEVGNEALLVLLDGAGGARGAVSIDPQFLAALIEVQTTGKVQKTEAEQRPFTQTDAAIAAPLLDAVLKGFDEQLKAAEPEYVAQGYRFGDMMEDARGLSLALEAPGYDLFRLTVDIEDGAKTGVLKLMLPERTASPVADDPAEAAPGGGFRLEKHALEAQVSMDAVLARVSLPLKEVCSLEPGMTVEISADSLSKAQLVATGGHVVAKVMMGQLNGWRAIRMIPDAAEQPVEVEAEAEPLSERRPRRPEVTQAAQGDDVLEGVAEPVPDLPDLPEAPDLTDLDDLPMSLGPEDPGDHMHPESGKAAKTDLPEKAAAEPKTMADLTMGR